MPVVLGTTEYNLGSHPVIGCGISWTDEELAEALSQSVVAKLFDDAGRDNCLAMLEGISDTEFDYTEIRRILENTHEPEAWRIGEAIAETYLSDHRQCHFPWPDSRDERKQGSSLPGADLVGLQANGCTYRFVFGEVKTSSDGNYPPNTMYGRTGLKQQLEDLRDQVEIRDGLVKYLWFRAVGSNWKDLFYQALIRYTSDCTDVQLFGILVRDVEPNEDDLRIRTNRLNQGCPESMEIELLAIYLPLGSADQLCRMVMELKGRAEHDDKS